MSRARPPEITAYFSRGIPFPARALNFRGVTLAPGPCKLFQLTKFTLGTCLDRFTTIVLLDLLGEMPLLQLLEAKLNCPGRRVNESKKRSDLHSEASMRLCFYRHARPILYEDRYRYIKERPLWVSPTSDYSIYSQFS